ncbi:MAG: hypothetical protein ACHQ0Y_11750, partial [Thermodesulfovibrionales bacterium]
MKQGWAIGWVVLFAIVAAGFVRTANADVPVKCVLVESRIVQVDSQFSRDLGVTFSCTGGNPATPVTTDIQVSMNAPFSVPPVLINNGASVIGTSTSDRAISFPHVVTLAGQAGSILQVTPIIVNAGALGNHVELKLHVETSTPSSITFPNPDPTLAVTCFDNCGPSTAVLSSNAEGFNYY